MVMRITIDIEPEFEGDHETLERAGAAAVADAAWGEPFGSVHDEDGDLILEWDVRR